MGVSEAFTRMTYSTRLARGARSTSSGGSETTAIAGVHRGPDARSPSGRRTSPSASACASSAVSTPTRNSSRTRRRHAASSTHDAAQNDARSSAGGANRGESSAIGGSARRRTAEAARSAHAIGSARHVRVISGSKTRSRESPPLGRTGPTASKRPETLERPPVPARTAARSRSSAAAAATCCAKLAKTGFRVSSSSVCGATANRPVSSRTSGPQTSVTPAASATARAAGVRGEKMSRAARALGGLRLQASDSRGATRWNTAGCSWSLTSIRGRHISSTNATGTPSSRTKQNAAAPRVFTRAFFQTSARNVPPSFFFLSWRVSAGPGSRPRRPSSSRRERRETHVRHARGRLSSGCESSAA